MIYSKLSGVVSTADSVQQFHKIIKIHTQESVKKIAAEYIEMLDDHVWTEGVKRVKNNSFIWTLPQSICFPET